MFLGNCKGVTLLLTSDGSKGVTSVSSSNDTAPYAICAVQMSYCRLQWALPSKDHTVPRLNLKIKHDYLCCKTTRDESPMSSSPYFPCLFPPRLFVHPAWLILPPCTSHSREAWSPCRILWETYNDLKHQPGNKCRDLVHIWAHSTLLPPLLPTCCSVHPAFSSCQTSFCLTTTNHPFLSESHKGDRSTGNSAYPMYGLEFWGSWSKAQILETWWLIFHLLWELGLIKDFTYFYEHCYVKIICLAQWVPLMLWECNVIFCCCFSKSLSTVNLCTVTHRGELPP